MLCTLLMLVLGVMAFPGNVFAGYLGPTIHGHYFIASASSTRIWLSDEAESDGKFPNTANITVRVRNIRREPVDDVPVIFELDPQCQKIAVFSSPRMITRGGTASVSFTGNAPGSCRIGIRVDDVTRDLHIEIGIIPDIPG